MKTEPKAVPAITWILPGWAKMEGTRSDFASRISGGADFGY